MPLLRGLLLATLPPTKEGTDSHCFPRSVRAQTAKFCPAQAGCPHLETVLA